MVVSLKTDLRFPIPGQQGHGGRIIQSQKDLVFKVCESAELPTIGWLSDPECWLSITELVALFHHIGWLRHLGIFRKAPTKKLAGRENPERVGVSRRRRKALRGGRRQQSRRQVRKTRSVLACPDEGERLCGEEGANKVAGRSGKS